MGEGTPMGKMDNILCWNDRGITSISKQREVKKMIGTRSLGLVSLIETKVKACKMGRMYQNYLVVGVLAPTPSSVMVVE